jgi:hypothetical protein
LLVAAEEIFLIQVEEALEDIVILSMAPVH